MNEPQNQSTDFLKAYPQVSRIEVIDETGRAWVRYGVNDVQLSIQDEGKTIKVFCRKRAMGR